MRDNYNELSGCNTDKNNLEKDRVDYDSHEIRPFADVNKKGI